MDLKIGYLLKEQYFPADVQSPQPVSASQMPFLQKLASHPKIHIEMCCVVVLSELKHSIKTQEINQTYKS